jgi:hypothetical protein
MDENKNWFDIINNMSVISITRTESDVPMGSGPVQSSGESKKVALETVPFETVRKEYQAHQQRIKKYLQKKK